MPTSCNLSSLFMIDLENPSLDRMQQGLFLESTFHVDTRDSKLSPRNLLDHIREACGFSASTPNVETHRVGEAEFVVTLNFRGDPWKESASDFFAMVQKHGMNLEKVLRRSFPWKQVERMDGYLDKVRSNTGSRTTHPGSWWESFIRRLLTLFVWIQSSLVSRSESLVRNDAVVALKMIREWNGSSPTSE